MRYCSAGSFFIALGRKATVQMSLRICEVSTNYTGYTHAHTQSAWLVYTFIPLYLPNIHCRMALFLYLDVHIG